MSSAICERAPEAAVLSSFRWKKRGDRFVDDSDATLGESPVSLGSVAVKSQRGKQAKNKTVKQLSLGDTADSTQYDESLR